MDLLDFNAEELYFDQPLDAETDGLLAAAAEGYADSDSEMPLLRAYFRQPEHLTVLVALYRYFYYEHRYPDALEVAERVLRIVGGRLGLNPDWACLTVDDLGHGVQQSMTQTRFYLFALKGAGFLELRMGRSEQALQRFDKIIELDASDRIGVTALADLARTALSGDDANDEIEAAA